jgi:hypothetical protein
MAGESAANCAQCKVKNVGRDGGNEPRRDMPALTEKVNQLKDKKKC